MLVEFTKSALEFLKLAPRYLISVAVISGALLFFQDTWPERLSLDSFVKANRQWLSWFTVECMGFFGVRRYDCA